MDLKKISAVCCLCLSFLFPLSSFAIYDIHGELLPVFWWVTIDGNVQLSVKKVPIKSNFLGGLVYFQLKRQQFGFYSNIILAYLSKDSKYEGYNVNVTNKFGVISGGFFYELLRSEKPCQLGLCTLLFEPYIGARYTEKDSYLKLYNEYLQLKGSHEIKWTDPLAGVRFTYLMGEQWKLFVSADIGGLGKDQYSGQLLGLLGYQPSFIPTAISLYVGYEYLHEHYATGKSMDDYFSWTMNFHGPVAGISLSF